jgi:hypothetical protein
VSIANVIENIEIERQNNAELGRKIAAKIDTLVAANDALRAQVVAQGEELLRVRVAIEDEIVARDEALAMLIDGGRIHANK